MVKMLSSKRRVAVAAALVLLALFLVRPGGSRLKSRIIISLSEAVGRPVDLSSVHIRLLPRPGFDLQNLVVYDDPAFGSEPILRASEVTADLRLLSMLRGRLEVSRLDLTEPSLNLVHHAGGGWNLASLLERTSHTPLAPTGKRRTEPRPGFPYIEGTSGRINFKNGPEKKQYALTNADFALWQDSENTWGVRLKAQPFRSDLNLNDMGQLQVNGTWQRAATFRETPVQLSLEWRGAQLGQVSKFFTGSDQGWRGALQADATVTGRPAALKISSTIAADDFRRYDITTGTSLHLVARCSGEYSAQGREFRGIACSAPVGAGLLTLAGDAGIPGSHQYAITVTAQEVPASALRGLAQRIKKNLPDDLALQGSVQGKFSAERDAASGSHEFEGQGQISELRVIAPSIKGELGPVTIPFLITDSMSRRGLRAKAEMVRGARIELGPFAIEKTRAGTATVRGWFDRAGYAFSVGGEADVGKSLRMARMFGLPALSTTAEGAAHLNLQLAGKWTGQGSAPGFLGPQVTGTVNLQAVHFAFRPGGESVEISAAEMQFLRDQVRIGKLSAKAAGANWKGSMEMPRGCGTPEQCLIEFQFNADELALPDVSAWVNSNSKARPWYRVLGITQPAPSLLARVQGSGHVAADRVILHGLAASKVSANVSLDRGKVQISSIEAFVLGGKHRGKWQADFSANPRVCGGSGSLTGVSLASLSKLMKDEWIEGTASAVYEIKGPCSADFWRSSEGEMRVSIAAGVFPHLSLTDDSDTVKMQKFNGQLRWDAGKMEISDAILESPDGKYEVTGTATFARQIDLKMARLPAGAGTASYAVTGTLAQPHVKTLSRTEQARLKR